VDARDRLRQYLEQRKEMGESDLVLDNLSVEDLIKVVGAPAGSTRAQRADEPKVSRRLQEPSPQPRDEPPAAAPAPVREGRYDFGSPTSPPAAPKPSSKPAPPAKPVDPADLTPIEVGGSIAEAAEATHARVLTSLDEVAKAVAACKLCGLHSTAKNAVPGEGNPEAKFVCVGEAPGATEDETGRPFVGQAGQLLTKILAAINFQREDVFICNVLKHRPPGNRNPQPDEIAVCSPYLLKQLALLQPRVILALGTFAAQTLLQTTRPIGKLRGQIHRFHGVPLVVTYHPAALLRNPNWKRPTWEDVQLARRVFDNALGA
jgi:uracil-DNA glycosylase family 4